MNPELLNIPESAQKALIEGARCSQAVAGLSHNFYRYPARFSPVFARAAIEVFTSPGDTVFDPYVGGGTSLVEALALGRQGIGTDISQLAEFVSSVKTTVLNDHEIIKLWHWANSLTHIINMQISSEPCEAYIERGYYKHLNGSSRWRLRKAIEQALQRSVELQSTTLEAFARCVILKTAQWALDGRKSLPRIPEFRAMLIKNAKGMIEAAHDLSEIVNRHDVKPHIKILNRSAIGIEDEPELKKFLYPKLIVTSPPYPGIHVLYHRWQVDGRKETAAPFWIANKLDGSGASYYSMGDRKNPELKTYFQNLKKIMSSVGAVCDIDTTVVQMVAFQDASWQLPRYLKIMSEVGFVEAMLPILKDQGDGRLWRRVPNRRWYSGQKGETPGSKEVVLIHRKFATPPDQLGHSDQRHPR